MQKENNRVPPPWGDDMEEALLAQGEAMRKEISVPRRRRLSRCRSTTLRVLGLIIAILLVWLILVFSMRHSHAAKLSSEYSSRAVGSRAAGACKESAPSAPPADHHQRFTEMLG